ncbi:hypothetical protein LTR62_005436 [Meristemomyces frigidus]|uniref:Major facilitator superfamily (MFS) profile domain-containing protein n=1 Tax=Meristemomyces frigidus TaxID=1508187 RepID=A0AAN7YJ95_9PEZI|nr:hypothetical protein LTR62_005436 [Meristemomyces frigidus]
MTNRKDNDVRRLEEISTEPDLQKADNAVTTYRSIPADELAIAEKKLVRKLDMRIMPAIVVIYILNYLDRNSIAQARLYGLQKDAHVTGALWNTAIAILSVGYIAMQIPSTLFMPRTRPSLFLPICMIVWAITSGCTAFVKTTGSLLAVRFCLGIAEAPFFPCAIYYLSCWYKKSELGIRMALLVSGIVISNAFAGLISAGILEGMSGRTSLHPWQWLFIIEALATIVVAVAAMFILPDYPGTTRWLTQQEKDIAQARLAVDVGSDDILDEEKIGIGKSLLQAAKDHRVWLFACMQMATTASISYSHFFPTLLKGLGFKNAFITLLLTSPPYVLGFFYAISLAWAADRMQLRSPFAGTSAVVALIGGIMAVALPSHAQWPRYVAMFFLVCGTYGIYCATYTWLSSTIPRPPAKRAASIGIANSFANLASFYANYFWLDKYAPDYTESWGTVIAFLVLALLCISALRFSLNRSNKKFERLAGEAAAGDLDMRGLSEEEHRAVVNGFRFVI